MATKNPRVVGYIDPEDHAKLQQFMREFDCTESKAIALILHSYFSSTPVSTPASRVNEAQGSTPNSTLDSTLIERLEALENKVEAFSSTLINTKSNNELVARIAELEKKLEALSSTPNSTLNNELLERLKHLENKLGTLSSTPDSTLINILDQEVVEPAQILSNIPGITPAEVETVVVEVGDDTSRQLEEEAAQKLESLLDLLQKSCDRHWTSRYRVRLGR